MTKGLQPAVVRAGITVDSGQVDKNGRRMLKAKYTGLHALRHSYGSWLINPKEDGGLGLTAKMVQERLGHASIYGRLCPSVPPAVTMAEKWRTRRAHS